MCGIAGFAGACLGFNETSLRQMTATLRHRGPDDIGVFFSKCGIGSVGLGHTRLSIIDLTQAAHQPMRFDGFAIVFNGEVYNFADIKKELIGLGYTFDSHSDTEVVLKAYHKWGVNCLQRFRGMWAFAIWDDRTQKLALCRDRVGVKPLYYTLQNNTLMFASELKAICALHGFKKELNKNALPYFFKYGYIPSPLSIYENVHKLDAGCYAVFDGATLDVRRYWDARQFYEDGLENRSIWDARSEESILDELESILSDSFALRLVSDIPLGVFLSGGVDSSLVAALLQRVSPKPLKTFTIGFHEQKYNEAPYAKEVASYLKTEHTELYCEPRDAYDIISALPTLYDEPFGDSSAIPTYLVSKLARGHVGVCLSADGADELFGGYSNYAPSIKLSNMLQRVPLSIRGAIAPLLLSKNTESAASFIHSLLPKNSRVTNFKDKYVKLANTMSAKSVMDVFDISKSYWFASELNDLLPWMDRQPQLYFEEGGDVLNAMMMQDMQTYMSDDILVKVDRATMGVSLEGREPFLDPKIIEFALAMPSSLKMKNGQNKYPLRQILYRHVPRGLVDRPKQGFGVPIHSWFKNELKDLYEYYLSKERLEESGLFDALYVRRMLQDYYAGKPVNAGKFWLLLSFEMWREKWL